MRSKRFIGGRWRPSGQTIGEGGQAQVLVVTDETGQLQGTWAAKVLRNETRIDRLAREIQTARRLGQQGAPVVEIVDDYLRTEPDASRAWFVMQIAEGGSLGKNLRSTSIYGGSVISALTLFRNITAAVLQFHKENVAHRDLKPDNILLTEQHKPLLADLGLCLPLGDLEAERLTGVLERIGSLHYLPKEAFGRRPLDEDQFAFDAYALGKILYQMVSGKVLPGFISPADPDFDLTKLENSPLFRGASRATRGLLHDTPAVRRATLADLHEQIGDLLEESAAEPVTDGRTREILLKAADGLALQALVPQISAPVDPGLTYEINSIRDEIYATWCQSSVLDEIKTLIISPNSDRMELVNAASAPKLRELLVGAGINTRRALEPVEDLGFPVFPTAEVGCAIGITTNENAPGVSSVWLAALVGSRNNKVKVATAVVVSSREHLGPRDIALGTASVLDVTVHDAALSAKIRTLAETSMQRFATTLAEQFGQKR
jgi:serine/threonine protein kinase